MEANTTISTPFGSTSLVPDSFKNGEFLKDQLKVLLARVEKIESELTIVGKKLANPQSAFDELHKSAQELLYENQVSQFVKQLQLDKQNLHEKEVLLLKTQYLMSQQQQQQQQQAAMQSQASSMNAMRIRSNPNSNEPTVSAKRRSLQYLEDQPASVAKRVWTDEMYNTMGDIVTSMGSRVIWQDVKIAMEKKFGLEDCNYTTNAIRKRYFRWKKMEGKNYPRPISESSFYNSAANALVNGTTNSSLDFKPLGGSGSQPPYQQQYADILPRFSPDALGMRFTGFAGSNLNKSMASAPPKKRRASTGGKRKGRSCPPCVKRKKACDGSHWKCQKRPENQVQSTDGNDPNASTSSTSTTPAGSSVTTSGVKTESTTSAVNGDNNSTMENKPQPIVADDDDEDDDDDDSDDTDSDSDSDSDDSDSEIDVEEMEEAAQKMSEEEKEQTTAQPVGVGKGGNHNISNSTSEPQLENNKAKDVVVKLEPTDSNNSNNSFLSDFQVKKETSLQSN